MSASPDTIARDIASHVAGATYEDLINDIDAAHRALEFWMSAYQTALTSTHHQAALAPPPLSAKEAAIALSVSRTKVDELLRAGVLTRVPSLDQHGVIRIARAQIDTLINEGIPT